MTSDDLSFITGTYPRRSPPPPSPRCARPTRRLGESGTRLEGRLTQRCGAPCSTVSFSSHPDLGACAT
jgi:hypothetical protein